MKLFKRACWVFLAVVALGLAHWLIAGFVELHKWARLSSTDWATWFGAIGTFSALSGTIYLATVETRRRNAVDFDRARLVAAGFFFRLKALDIVLEDTNSLSPQSPPLRSARYMIYAQRLLQACNWNAEELAALVVLPNHAAFHLEVTRAKIERCAQNLDHEATLGTHAEQHEAFVVAIQATLGSARKSLTIALLEVERILPNLHPS
jgi:hypothetical protein